ncbi:MAG: Ig-like domain-containing protein, partial [bacterium]
YVQLGVYPARIIARDGFGLADTATIEFEVLDAPNQAPVIERIYSQSVFPGQELRIDVVASDVDGTIPTLELIVAPDNMTFEDYGDGIGSLTMIPDSSQFGEHAVMVTASDGELADTSAFSVTVALDTATFFQDGLIPCAVGNQWTYETIRCLGYGDCVVSRPETTTVTVTSLEFADGRLWWYLDRRWMFLGSRFAVSGDTIFYGNGSEIIFEDGRSWTVVVNPDEYWGVSYNHHIHFYEEPCLCGGFEPELGQSRFDYQISGSFGPAYGMHYEGTRYSLVPGIGFVCHIDLYGEMSYSDGDGQRLIDYEIREPE